MEDRILALSNYRIDKAKEDLESSKALFTINKYAQSINRSYYSMFHSTRALLAFDKFDSKKHSGIIAYFNQNYIQTDKIEYKYFESLREAERIRNKSDYNDFYIATKDQAESQLKNAEEFINKIKDYIKNTFIIFLES